MEIRAAADRELVRTRGGSRRNVKVFIEAPPGPDAGSRGGSTRPPVSLALVLDRSGSMSGDKIERARAAARQTVHALGPRDRLSVVAYNERASILVSRIAADGAGRTRAEEALALLEAGGTTNLGEGWLLGCEQAGACAGEGMLARVFLLSDGLANVGIQRPEELARHAAELRRRGVSTSTFGVGLDFDEVLLARMAEAGGGAFYYIEHPHQIPDYVASAVGETLEVVVREAALVVRASAPLEVGTLTGHAVEGMGRREHRVLLGDLVAAQLLEPILRFTFPGGEEEETLEVELSLEGAGGPLPGAPACLVFRYADDRANDRQLRDIDVQYGTAGMMAAGARRRALQLNREGRYREARAEMLDVAREVARLAERMPQLLPLLERLREEADEYGRPLHEGVRKSRYSESSYSLSLRSARGAALRRRPPGADRAR